MWSGPSLDLAMKRDEGVGAATEVIAPTVEVTPPAVADTDEDEDDEEL